MLVGLVEVLDVEVAVGAGAGTEGTGFGFGSGWRAREDREGRAERGGSRGFVGAGTVLLLLVLLDLVVREGREARLVTVAVDVVEGGFWLFSFPEAGVGSSWVSCVCSIGGSVSFGFCFEGVEVGVLWLFVGVLVNLAGLSLAVLLSFLVFGERDASGEFSASLGWVSIASSSILPVVDPIVFSVTSLAFLRPH